MNPANHIMIDLETIGTRPGSAILTIGAVRFDPAANGLSGRDPRWRCPQRRPSIAASTAKAAPSSACPRTGTPCPGGPARPRKGVAKRLTPRHGTISPR